MKASWSIPVVLALLFAQACNQSRPKTAAASAPMLSRACQVAVAADAGRDETIAKLQGDLRERRSPAGAAEQLGYRYVAKARLSNDAGFYTLAEQTAACLESFEPNDPAALLLRGHAFHQMHRFAEAEQIARRLVGRREFVLDYGLLGDALMEQGRLAEAATAYQKMIDLKPFYQSYTRAAHLRWLKGDLDGAIELMQSAVRAVSPRDKESVAWAYSRLAVYELQRGRLDEAARMTEASLQYVPDYAAALLAQGRIRLAQRKPKEAVAALDRAARLNPLPEFQWALADALRAENRADDARAIEKAIVASGAEDPRTVSLYLSTRREERDRAVQLARQELEKRRDIFTLDALAWALAAAGEIAEASDVMNRALAEGTQDGRLFLHAAVIAAASGRPAEAKRWASKARMLQFTLLPSELGVLRTGIVASPQS
jgi:tetratricopeptide (TPR) repeat protein